MTSTSNDNENTEVVVISNMARICRNMVFRKGVCGERWWFDKFRSGHINLDNDSH